MQHGGPLHSSPACEHMLTLMQLTIFPLVGMGHIGTGDVRIQMHCHTRCLQMKMRIQV